MSLLSKEEISNINNELAHYGIPGQKKGVRRWQYEDGRFNDEGKIRYFGEPKKKANLLNKWMNSYKISFGIDDKDSAGAVAGKIGVGMLSNFIIPGAGLIASRILGYKKAQRNYKKLTKKDQDGLKAFLKAYTMDNLSQDMYNIRRKEGQGRLRSYFGATIADKFKNLFTLGDYAYNKKEQYGLEHSKINKEEK